jgi:cell division transport system permease protein
MMLTSLKMFFKRHVQAAAHGFHLLFVYPWSLAMTSVVIAVSLTIPSLFWMLGHNVQSMLKQWSQNTQFTLYLKPSLEPSRLQELTQKVQQFPEVEHVFVKTAQANLKELEQQEGMSDVLSLLPSNPLPAILEVKLKPSKFDLIQLKSLGMKFQAISGIEQVKYNADWLRQLNAILSLVKALVRSMLILLALGVIFIIANTLRLTLNARRDELSVLKLIGAPDNYIMRPFLYLGMGYGLLGGVVSILFIHVFLYSLGGAIDEWVASYQMNYPYVGFNLAEAYALVLFSVGLGWISAQALIRYQLSSLELLG